MYSSNLHAQMTSSRCIFALMLLVAASITLAERYPVVSSNSTTLMVDGIPLREFTLFSAALRDEKTLIQFFQKARKLGYNCARVGSETADWPKNDSVHDYLHGLHGPEPGSKEQLNNLDRIVRVAGEQQMALEICVVFTIKDRPMKEQLAYSRLIGRRLCNETHVFFTAVNEAYVHSDLNISDVNKMLTILKQEAPYRLRGVDEIGSIAPKFLYDYSLCDFVAWHWPRGANWDEAPNLKKTVEHWLPKKRPVLLNEIMCYYTEEEEKWYGKTWECKTTKHDFVELMDNIYDDRAFGCFHSIWGLRSEAFGWAPFVGNLTRQGQ